MRQTSHLERDATGGATMSNAITDHPAADLSIVVPTLNEERNLQRLLQSIRSQGRTPREVIVVDQASTDRTGDVAEAYGCIVVQVPPSRFYSPPARSRNAGAGAANGRYLVHLDADMELPDPHFLERLQALFDDQHRAVVIHERDVPQGFWGRVKALERESYWNSPVEAARASTRELFEEVGGYDERISSGEDFWIADCYAQRTIIASADDLWVLHHTGRPTLRRLLKKKFSYGRTVSEYLKRKRTTARGRPSSYVWTCVRAYARRPGRTLRHPLRFFAMVLLRLLELTAVAAGMTAQKMMDISSAARGRGRKRQA